MNKTIKTTLVLAAGLILVGCSDPGYYSSSFYGANPQNDMSDASVPPDYFPQTMDTGGKKAFRFSPKAKIWAAYDEHGNLVRTGRATGGVDECPETGGNCRTGTGSFTVTRKGDHACTSKTYPLGEGGAPMPYCMFFNKGQAIHGTSEVPSYNASHGCVRVHTNVAQWLNENFLEVGSKVVVESY